jgi:spore maturation protein CgeB
LHASLFNDDEVLFFRSNEELLKNIHYFMEHSDIASEYAKRAAKRCVVSGYDHMNTILTVLQKIER